MVSKKQLVKKRKPSIKLPGFIGNLVTKMHASTDRYLARRPHRSFRRTRRRDYARSLKMPGYWSFSNYTIKTLLHNRKTFLLLALTYTVLTILLVGMASQDTFTTLISTLTQTSGDAFKGNLGQLGQAGLLLLTIMSGGISQNLTEGQQIYATIIALLTWLTTIWMLRNILAEKKVKLRDGLYNAGSPILATFVVALVLVIQLIPFALALIGYSAASATGLLSNGVEAMLFWIVAGLLTLLSLYWITSTIVALVVVTLPGMYPFRAIKTAGDLVIGRRVRIMMRLLWMVIGAFIAWVVVMIPIILLVTWLNSLWPALQGVPVIPFVIVALSSLTIVWASSYVYLLYRKVVADDADPA